MHRMKINIKCVKLSSKSHIKNAISHNYYQVQNKVSKKLIAFSLFSLLYLRFRSDILTSPNFWSVRRIKSRLWINLLANSTLDFCLSLEASDMNTSLPSNSEHNFFTIISLLLSFVFMLLQQTSRIFSITISKYSLFLEIVPITSITCWSYSPS